MIGIAVVVVAVIFVAVSVAASVPVVVVVVSALIELVFNIMIQISYWKYIKSYGSIINNVYD